MRKLYLDCFSGIAGDMTLAALIDLGADIDYIQEHLRKLPIDPFEMKTRRVVKRGVAAKQLQLRIDETAHSDHHHVHHDDRRHGHHDHHHDHDHRRASEILAMIEQSDLPARVKRRSLKIFQLIAEAEGKIHGIRPEDVHFHEVGAMDSIIDTIGVCLALENLGVDEIFASPVATGQGYAKMAHGLYPIPAPATLELLKGIPLADLEARGELTTPTGAGILKALVKQFKPLASARVERVGYGAGTKDFDHPNVLRAILLQEDRSPAADQQSVCVLEAQVDDMTGEALGYAMEALFEAGALDVYYTPIQMKKNRPGTLMTVIAQRDNADDCERALLAETTTLGVRRSIWERTALRRRIVKARTAYGEIKVKQALREDGAVYSEAPEFEDVSAAAKRHGVSFLTVYQETIKQLKN